MNNLSMKMKYGNDWNAPLKKREGPAAIEPEKESDLFNKSKKEPALDAGLNKVVFFNKKIKHELSARQLVVLDTIKLIQSCSMHQVADYLKVPLNTISGRFGELVKLGRIQVVSRAEDRSLYKIIEKGNPNV